jgi:hypothetical protein
MRTQTKSRHSTTRLQQLNRESGTAALKRMARLLRIAPGAWVVAVAPASARPRLLARLRSALAPLPIHDQPLDPAAPDPLPIARAESAPVLSLSGVGAALPDLGGYLDLQRDTLATLPHRIVLWVTPDELAVLARQAPNFYSRLGGVFALA